MLYEYNLSACESWSVYLRFCEGYGTTRFPAVFMKFCASAAELELGNALPTPQCASKIDVYS